jgi:hypothetical protein
MGSVFAAPGTQKANAMECMACKMMVQYVETMAHDDEVSKSKSFTQKLFKIFDTVDSQAQRWAPGGYQEYKIYLAARG